MKKGLIQIYTGNGKGKTTAAIGLAVRAVSRGLKVCFITFFKPNHIFEPGQGKLMRSTGVDVYNLIPEKLNSYEKKGFKKCRKKCLDLLLFIEKTFYTNYGLLILDEMNIILKMGYIKNKEILNFIERKPEKTEIVFTGRYAPQSLIKKAHLVSEIKKIKHPYDTGIKERKGIDG
ncbi:MAG: cob(I)yrinic acid a,c-diamide adenosyltransferase [Elusimicrobia bacterium]|nr:cob(I)yrinic acid a,c-diamide adenosyltransferase [Elusimicrobiota bacterium]